MMSTKNKQLNRKQFYPDKKRRNPNRIYGSGLSKMAPPTGLEPVTP